FFSRRRLHKSFSRDCSSDVCYSDLQCFWLLRTHLLGCTPSCLVAAESGTLYCGQVPCLDFLDKAVPREVSSIPIKTSCVETDYEIGRASICDGIGTAGTQ